MDGWLSFLIFGALFFLMMRFGCGAHMAHGRDARPDKASDRSGDVDPVCGATVPNEVGYGKMQNGKLYRFCSRQCLDEFEKTPQAYIAGDEKLSA